MINSDTLKVKDFLTYLGRASTHVEEQDNSPVTLALEHHKQESWNELIGALNERLAFIEQRLDSYLTNKETITQRAREVNEKVINTQSTQEEQRAYLKNRLSQLQGHLTTLKGENKHTPETKMLSLKMGAMKRKLS